MILVASAFLLVFNAGSLRGWSYELTRRQPEGAAERGGRLAAGIGLDRRSRRSTIGGAAT